MSYPQSYPQQQSSQQQQQVPSPPAQHLLFQQAGTFPNMSTGLTQDAAQQGGHNAGSMWFPDAGMQLNLQGNIVQQPQQRQLDNVDGMTTWTPSYASVGGDGFASAYSASLADIAEEGGAHLAGIDPANASGAAAYDPLISDTYDKPQQNQMLDQIGAVGHLTGNQNAGVDFSTLLGGTSSWAQNVGATQATASSNDAGAPFTFGSSHASPADSSMSPPTTMASASFGMTGGGPITAEIMANWARNYSVGQDNLNTALNSVHISDDNRYQPVFSDDNDAPITNAGESSTGGLPAGNLRITLPQLDTTVSGMDLDMDGYKVPQSADVAALLQAWASTAGGLPSPAAAEAINRAAAFGEALNSAHNQHDGNSNSNPSVSGPATETTQAPKAVKLEGLTVQTSALPTSEANTLSAHLQNFTPVRGSFDRRSLAQPMRSESFEKIKFLLNEGRMITPTSATAGNQSFSASGTAAPAPQDTSAVSMSPKDVFMQLFSSTGLDPARSQAVFDQLQHTAHTGKEAEQAQAQAHLAMLGLIGEGLGMGEMSTSQWEMLGLKDFNDPMRAAAAMAVAGQDLTVMPMRYGVATSDTRTQIGEGASAGENATRESRQETLDPSVLHNTREGSLGPQRQRNWSSSARGRPSVLGGGGSDPYRTHGSGPDAGPSYLGGSSAHPYGAPDALRRSGSERSEQRRHRRAAKSEDLTRLAQEGNQEYVNRVTSTNGMLAPPSTFGNPGGGAGGSASFMAQPSFPHAFNGSVPYQQSSLSSLMPSPPGHASDGTPSLSDSRSGQSLSTAGSPATTWTSSPSGGSGQGMAVNGNDGPLPFANMHALASSALAQQQQQQQHFASFVPSSSGAYSQTAAPMYGHLMPAGKPSLQGMLPPSAPLGGGVGPGPAVGPANHVSAATQAASAARRKTDAVFACPVPGCGSTFTRKNNLDGHIRSHNNERPFVCPVPGCDKRFARRHDMNRHHDLHTNKKQHVCELCQRRFARLDALNRHLKTTNGTCTATSGPGEDGDSSGEGGAMRSQSVSSASSSGPAAVKKEELVAEPLSTTESSDLTVAVSAPTPASQGPQDDERDGVDRAGPSNALSSSALAQLPILVTPSRQNSATSSGGGGANSSRFRGHVL